MLQNLSNSAIYLSISFPLMRLTSTGKQSERESAYAKALANTYISLIYIYTHTHTYITGMSNRQ